MDPQIRARVPFLFVNQVTKKKIARGLIISTVVK
jgi:hypothetical protein